MRILVSLVPIVSFFLLTSQSFSLVAAPLAPRPPQYVELAFDGSLSLPMWGNTRAFAATLTSAKQPFHFTYFISAVYFLTHANSNLYRGPRKLPGQSDIGFGYDANDLLARIDHINKAIKEGHEIGSHLNGHFDGSTWTTGEWEQEFSVFDQLIANVFTTNQLMPSGSQPTKLNISGDKIFGFRAPYLATSPGLYETEKNHHYRYDTSKTDVTSYWPKKNPLTGVWNFPLAQVRIAGTGKKTLSMDYNFYFTQSGAKEDPPNEVLYEKQMYDTYMQYFASNYNGNRAPLHIGHHFKMMNGGAYWRAMQNFAKTVCGQPEVNCVSYIELADYMDTLDTQTLADYQKGNFEKGMPFEVPPGTLKPLQLELTIEQGSRNQGRSSVFDDQIRAHISGADTKNQEVGRIDMHWEVNGEALADPVGEPIQFNHLKKFAGPGQTVKLSAVGTLGEVEVLRTTHKVTTSLDGKAKLIMSEENLENAALKGDMKQAHEN